MQLGGYIRVSQVGGRAGDSFISPDVQRDAVGAYARAHGHHVADWFEDLDVSGGTLDRPALGELLAKIERGELDGLAVARLDRLSRAGVADALQLVQQVTDRGGAVVAVDLGLDPTTMTGELVATVLLALARMERRRITEGWRESNARAIARGIHFARPPFGYRRGDDGRLKPDPDAAPIVRDVFQRRALRESWRSIAAWLNDAHPRHDGRAWTSRTVATMVQRRTYLGTAFHGEHELADAHEAIVTLPEFEAANAVRGGPGAIHERSALLAGLIRCAGCRYAMRRTTVKARNGERVPIYSCQRKHTGGVCPAPANVLASKIEPYVTERVLQFIGLVEWEVGPSDDATEAARRRLEDAEARLAAFLADGELAEIVGREAHLAEARKRRAAVDAARDACELAVGAEHAGRRRYLLGVEWEKWADGDREGLRGETLRQALESVYVRKGRGPIEERCLIRWDGEDPFERPRRGTTDYRIQPVVWPPDAWLACIPEWAWRNGHPAIREDVRERLHEAAEARGLEQFLPNAA